MDNKKYKSIIEAILFTMGESVELSRIADAIELDKATTKKIILEMQKEMNESERGLTIIELDESYQMCTKTGVPQEYSPDCRCSAARASVPPWCVYSGTDCLYH